MDSIIKSVPDWVRKYNEAGHTSSAGRALRVVMELGAKQDKELLELRRELSELLAIMHGDGGHYEDKHGTLKALVDAKGLLHTKWVVPD